MTKRSLKTALYAAAAVTLALSITTASFAQFQQNRSRQYQQSDNPVDALIGMIGRVSAKSKAKKKWAQVGPDIQQCVNIYLEPRKITVHQMIAEGLSPDHEKVAPIVTVCHKAVTTQLKENFPCKVVNAKGVEKRVEVTTVCQEFFAKAVNGQWVAISRDDYIRASARKEAVTVIAFETLAAESARLAEEKRLAREAAAKAEAARVERLAREEAARKAREEERQRFLASPEGKQQAAEQAASERRAEIKRQAEARLAATPLSPAQARSMLRVWPERKWVSVWESFALYLNVQALEPSVKIMSISVNRGSCSINHLYAFPININYGQTLSSLIASYPECNVISAEIGTSKGVAYFRF